MEQDRRSFLITIGATAAALAISRGLEPHLARAGEISTARTPAKSTAGWQRGFESLREEQSYAIEQIEGKIPEGLTGTLYRNGPALNDVNGQPFGHWFDGDGMLSAVTFVRGQAYYRNRFVRTQAYVDERAAGKVLYRGYGTQRPGGALANAFRFPQNRANTSVVLHGGKLLALWEGGLPYALDPRDLATLGPWSYDGQLGTRMPFSAHPKVDPVSGELWNFGVSYGRSATLHFYRVGATGRLEARREIALPEPVYVHDFALTERYCVFCLGPAIFSPLSFLLGLASFEGAFRWDPSIPTRVLLVPRDGGEHRILATDPFFQFHFANAYERDGQLWVDLARYPDFSISERLRLPVRPQTAAALWRLRVDPAGGVVEGTALAPGQVEFPQWDLRRTGRPYRFVYTVSLQEGRDSFPTGLLRVDLSTGKRAVHDFGPLGYPGEPIFVPARENAEEDDGWVLTFVYDATAHRTRVVVLDARDLAAQPLAVLSLRHHVPFGFHGIFTPNTFGIGPEA